MSKAVIAMAVGVLGGLGGGFLGVGGGTVMVPLSVLWLRLSQHKAHATSLAAIAPVAVVGALSFAAAGEVDVRAALGLAAGAFLGAPLGAKVMAGLSEGRLKIVFGIFMVIVGALMAF